MKKYIIIIILCAGASWGFSQDSDSIMVKRIMDETMTNSTSYENLRKLCKQVGPRLSGSVKYLQAVTLVSEMMKKTGADNVYLQQCMVPHWVRGEKEKGQIILAGNKKYDLKLCALGNSVGTGTKGITADVIEVTSIAQLNQLGTNGITGKIIFFNFPMNPTYIKTFRAYGESGVSRTRGPSLAGKYGAVGAITCQQPE